MSATSVPHTMALKRLGSRTEKAGCRDHARPRTDKSGQTSLGGSPAARPGARRPRRCGPPLGGARRGGMYTGRGPVNRTLSVPTTVTSRLRPFHMLAALSVIASLSMSFSFSIIPMTPDLDPSFVYSFNHAAARGLKWGQEFISTYGP